MGQLVIRRDISRVTSSIVTSRRRVEIPSMSEMTPVINCLLHTLLAQQKAYQLFHRVFQPFQPFK